MRLSAWKTVALAAVAILVGCGDSGVTEFSCEPVGNQTPICGFSHPEDLELLPDGKTLIVSEFGSLHADVPGALVLFDTQSGRRQRLPAFATAAAKIWIDVDCPGPPGDLFSPHGIHLSERADGKLQLLAVNHGGGERIDFFEVRPTSNWWRIDWRGCAVPPEHSFMNDVVATPDGGFVFTHMYPKNSLQIGPLSMGILKAMLKMDVGYAMHFDGTGYRVLEGSRAAFANGIQIDDAGEFVYVNALMNDKVYKVNLKTGERVGTADAPRGDNIQWNASGELLVASQVASAADMTKCLNAPDSTCGARYEIVKVNPQTLESKTIFVHEGGPPMGGATVAQQVGDKLYLGSFAGDRILVIPYPDYN